MFNLPIFEEKKFLTLIKIKLYHNRSQLDCDKDERLCSTPIPRRIKGDLQPRSRVRVSVNVKLLRGNSKGGGIHGENWPNRILAKNKAMTYASKVG